MEVVAAIIQYEGKILCMQSGKGKFSYLDFKYEFPGGKIEKGESQIEALKRELREEMDLEASVSEDDFFMTVDYKYFDFDITLHSYLFRVNSDKFNRKEHVSHVWLFPYELDKLEWAAADAPILQKLIDMKE